LLLLLLLFVRPSDNDNAVYNDGDIPFPSLLLSTVDDTTSDEVAGTGRCCDCQAGVGSSQSGGGSFIQDHLIYT